jgi:uncharacterized protein YegP (UPF0339 family)
MTDIIIEPYQGKKQGRQSWRWRAKYAANNRKAATGGEAYANKEDCEKAIRDLFGDQTTVEIHWPDAEPEILRTAAVELT